MFNTAHSVSILPQALGCDFDAIPKCAQARMDIDDFVSWDIDHIKVDGCGPSSSISASRSVLSSTLKNAMGSSRVTLSLAAAGALKSSLWAMAGGNGA